MNAKFAALAIVLGMAGISRAQYPIQIPKPAINLAGWASELEFSRAGAEFVKNLANEWVFDKNYIRLSINPHATIKNPSGAYVLGLPSTPEEQVTSWGPGSFYVFSGMPLENHPITASHFEFGTPTTPDGPAQAPRRHGYFFNIEFNPASVPLAPATSYTVSIDIESDYCHAADPYPGTTGTPTHPWGYVPPPNVERQMVRSTTRLTFAISKSPARASSVDTRLAYGNPDATGLLIPDPNAALGHLAFRPYAFKGGLFIGRMPVAGKDKSGEARIHVASPGLPAPPSGAWLMGRSVQLYCAETPPGVIGTFSAFPALTTSTFAQSFYDQPAITWSQRADILDPTIDSYSYELEGIKRNFSLRMTAEKTINAIGHSGLAILPPTTLNNTSGQGGSQSQTGIWRYFVQDGATPRIPAPSPAIETQPTTYNVYLLSGEVLGVSVWARDATTGTPYLKYVSN